MAPLVHQVESLHCPIHGTEAMSLLTEHTFPRHSHEHFGIGVVTQGAQRSWSVIGQVEAGPGDVIVVNPGEIHDGMPLNGPRTWKMIYLQPQLLLNALNADEYRADAVINPRINDPHLKLLLTRLFNSLAKPNSDIAAIEELLLLSLMHISCHHLLTANHQPSTTAEIKLAKQYIDDAPANAVSLNELAEMCNLSPFQLLRSFSHQQGITPHAYIVQSRVRQAQRFLAQGTAIAEVALMVGFADQSHLTRAFVRQLGLTPARYQRSYCK